MSIYAVIVIPLFNLVTSHQARFATAEIWANLIPEGNVVQLSKVYTSIRKPSPKLTDIKPKIIALEDRFHYKIQLWEKTNYPEYWEQSG